MKRHCFTLLPDGPVGRHIRER